MDIHLREAKVDDAALIVELTRAAWAGKVAATSGGHRETLDTVSEHLQRGGAFLLSVDGQTAGSVRWLPVEAQPTAWEMMRMGVLPSYRGRGLSQYLLEAILERARAAGAEELRLGVRADQPRLLDLYSAYEFELAPELEYSHANPADAPPFVMRRYLRTHK
ncbi:MAG: family N-acetyltransferase [Paucimonas sp.]|jgi:ribosomal protein S18 acetylase RimI-like enzyme|nr:family N-acetyltransferase [Paucimonas sp.]